MTRLLCIPLYVLAAFCIYGTLASTEPGTNEVFRIAYPIVGVAAAAAGLWLLLRKLPHP